MQKDIVPVLLGADINVVGMSRAFYDEYGVKSIAIGKYNSGPCKDSKIIDYRVQPNIEDETVYLSLINKIANDNKDALVFVLGCGDHYLELISKCKLFYAENIVAPYIDYDVMKDIINKEKFYAMCEKVGVDYPDTYVHRKELGFDFSLPFDPPYIAKPSRGIEYFAHPFEGQKKAYKLETYEELIDVLKKVYESGYDDSMIIQNFIPGDDSYMRVMTGYSTKDAKVVMTCMGHVLLEEHTPTGIGNHAVIITEPHEETELKLKALLEDIGYTGFSNFDMKYDERDGKYKVFELNCRQGRSNYYVTASNENLAKLLVEDYTGGSSPEYHSVTAEFLWMVILKKTAFKYVNKNYHDDMKRLIAEHKCVNPLWNPKDRGFKKTLRYLKSQFRYAAQFDEYMK